jgi:L-threonylcarbamoyladenylate synthase
MAPPRVVALNPDDPRPDRLQIAVDALATGGIAAIPTETFYGLAGDAFRADVLLRLNQLKSKGADAPVLLLLADIDQVELVARDLPDSFAALAERFWPGPLTIVVRAGPGVPVEVSGGRGTVGIRVPGLALPRRLAAALGRPITGVSANLHGEPACRTAEEVVRVLPRGVDVVLDGGPCPGGAPSTIVDISDGPARLLRRGSVPLSALGPFLERGRVPFTL